MRRARVFCVMAMVAGVHVADTSRLTTARAARGNLRLDVTTVVRSITIPAAATVRSQPRTLSALYLQAGITLERRDATIDDSTGGRPYRDGELDELLRNTPPITSPPSPSDWFVKGFVVPALDAPERGDEVVGIMFDPKGRSGFAVARNSDSARMLRTAAHELGHALNLFHSDGDADLGCCGRDPEAPRGPSIMNQDVCLSNDWDFQFSPAELTHLKSHDVKFVRPGTCYGVCIQQHRELCPDSTDEGRCGS